MCAPHWVSSGWIHKLIICFLLSWWGLCSSYINVDIYDSIDAAFSVSCQQTQCRVSRTAWTVGKEELLEKLYIKKPKKKHRSPAIVLIHPATRNIYNLHRKNKLALSARASPNTVLDIYELLHRWPYKCGALYYQNTSQSCTISLFHFVGDYCHSKARFHVYYVRWRWMFLLLLDDAELTLLDNFLQVCCQVWMFSVCVCQTFQTSPLENLEALSVKSNTLVANPTLMRGINCGFLTFKPLNKAVKCGGCWKNWERGCIIKKKKKKKTEQGEGCTSRVCARVHACICTMTSPAMPVHVSMSDYSVSWWNNIPVTTDQRGFHALFSFSQPFGCKFRRIDHTNRIRLFDRSPGTSGCSCTDGG